MKTTLKSMCVTMGLALGAAGWIPAAHAELVGAAQLVAPDQVTPDRARITSFVARPEVVKQLQAMGVPPEQAQARVAAMSEDEVRAVAGRLDALPAAGNTWTDFQVFVLVLLSAILVALVI